MGTEKCGEQWTLYAEYYIVAILNIRHVNNPYRWSMKFIMNRLAT